MLFHFKRIKNAAVFNQKINFIHLFVSVKIKRRFNDTPVVIAFYDFGNHKALKECARHCAVFQYLSIIPFGKIGSKPGIQKIQLRRLDRSFGNVVGIRF